MAYRKARYGREERQWAYVFVILAILALCCLAMSLMNERYMSLKEEALEKAERLHELNDAHRLLTLRLKAMEASQVPTNFEDLKEGSTR